MFLQFKLIELNKSKEKTNFEEICKKKRKNV